MRAFKRKQRNEGTIDFVEAYFAKRRRLTFWERLVYFLKGVLR